MQSYLGLALSKLSINQLLPHKVNLFFAPDVTHCSCGSQLQLYKTKTRGIATLLTGECNAHITQLRCKHCKIIYASEELKQIVPENSHFGFDVIVYVGRALFIHHRNDDEIQASLRKNNISISLREISYLGKKFIVYLALAHRASKEKINNHINSKGGYILHLDGTCEGDSPHLFSFIDELSKIVLDNIKIPSENTQQIQPALEDIKKSYGAPTAIVHDMSSAIISAVGTVFPDAKDFICHLHFLRDLGKDLFSAEYSCIRRYLKSSKIRTALRKSTRELKIYIEGDEELKNYLVHSTEKDFFKNNQNLLAPPVALYLLLTWVLESKSKSQGYGFPFDRPHVDFCLRLQEALPIMQRLKTNMPSGSPRLSLAKFSRILNDNSLKTPLSLIKEKMAIFDELRDAMRIIAPEGKEGLNDNGSDVDIKTIESGVKKFRESEKIISLAKTNIRFKKMVKQIDKYWNKLFADPIEVKTDGKIVMIQPQRTNNMLEQFFRNIKSGCRKKSGTSSLSKTLKAMMANTPLVKNLNLPDYVEIILNGRKDLAERFAEIEIASVRATLSQEDESARKYSKGMAKIFRMSDLPTKIDRVVEKMREAG